MMKIYGKVTNSDLSTAPLDLSCKDTCYDKEYCILANMDHDGHCILYGYNETEALEVVRSKEEDGVMVAFKAILLGEKTSRTAAKGYCEAMGYKLSGLASVEEVDWVLAKIMNLKPDMDNWQGFWIDGVRECDECPDFYWTDGYTQGDTILNSGISSLGNSAYQTGDLEGCLSVANIASEEGMIINDAVCANDPYQWGAVCGYRLL